MQISSIGASAAIPRTGLYSASKFALEGMSEALAAEAAAFGVKLTIVEPGGYWTDLYTRMRCADPDPAYAPLREELERQWEEGSVDSEPRLAAEALMTLVDERRPAAAPAARQHVYDLAVDAHAAADGDVGAAGSRSAAPRSTPSPHPS